jgi:hypothetical protein
MIISVRRAKPLRRVAEDISLIARWAWMWRRTWDGAIVPHDVGSYQLK